MYKLLLIKKCYFSVQSSEESGSESETEQPKETEKKQKHKPKVCYPY